MSSPVFSLQDAQWVSLKVSYGCVLRRVLKKGAADIDLKQKKYNIHIYISMYLLLDLLVAFLGAPKPAAGPEPVAKTTSSGQSKEGLLQSNTRHDPTVVSACSD